jgi:hypothetical protein
MWRADAPRSGDGPDLHQRRPGFSRRGDCHYVAGRAIVNRIGTYNETVTLDTVHGPVSVEYTTTPCTAAGVLACADTVCVVVAPDGVVPVPECAEIMEKDSGEILLMKWVGG